MRYAIYYAPPPGTRLHHLGASWLGRDAFGHVSPTKKLSLGAITDDPMHYGFHATLKAPFSMKDGQNYADLLASFESFARGRSAVYSGKIVLRDVDGFLALVPEHPPQALDQLASDCVEHFDTFRGPPDEVELARRRKSVLTTRQEIHLEKWGYPYVHEDFRFHMTLTRRLSAEEKSCIFPTAQKHFTDVIGTEVIIDQLCIFHEANSQLPFTVQHSAKLGLGRPKAL